MLGRTRTRLLFRVLFSDWWSMRVSDRVGAERARRGAGGRVLKADAFCKEFGEWAGRTRA